MLDDSFIFPTQITRGSRQRLATSNLRRIASRCALPRRIHGDLRPIQIFHGLSLLLRSFTRLRRCEVHACLSCPPLQLKFHLSNRIPWFENNLPHTKSSFSCTTHRQDTVRNTNTHRKQAHSIFIAISKVIFSKTLDRLARFVSSFSIYSIIVAIQNQKRQQHCRHHWIEQTHIVIISAYQHTSNKYITALQ